MSKVSVDTKELDRFAVKITKYQKDSESNVKSVVRTSTFNVENYAKNNLTANGSVDTGRLRGSINSKVSSLEGIVSTNVNYAKIVEEGSKPHIIKPKNKKFLYWKGAKHPVKQVKHPGSKAKPYMSTALEKETPNFLKEMQKAVRLP